MASTIELPSSVTARRRDHLVRYAIYLLLVAVGIIVTAPFIWMLLTAFKRLPEVFAYPPQLLPESWRWRNFVDVWTAANFSRYFLNSIIVASAATLGQLVTGSLAAYAFARMEFKGRDILFYTVLGTLMIPMEVLLVPDYAILKSLGWLNSYLALTVPFMAGAFGIFLLRQHFKTIPKELEDAAKIDGCNSLRFFVSILLPLSKPALTALAVFEFLSNWNMYVWPLVVTRDDRLYTIQVGLAAFKESQINSGNTDWPLLMAASTISLIPVLLIFIFGQRWLTEGYTSGALKG